MPRHTLPLRLPRSMMPLFTPPLLSPLLLHKCHRAAFDTLRRCVLMSPIDAPPHAVRRPLTAIYDAATRRCHDADICHGYFAARCAPMHHAQQMRELPRSSFAAMFAITVDAMSLCLPRCRDMSRVERAAGMLMMPLRAAIHVLLMRHAAPMLLPCSAFLRAVAHDVAMRATIRLHDATVCHAATRDVFRLTAALL